MVSLDIVSAIILIGSLLILFGILSSLVATRFGVPLLLVFLVLGMLAGEDGPGGLVFNDYQTTYLVGSLALAVILFDGGLRTKISIFRSSLLPSMLLATLGVLITAALVGAVAYYMLDGWTILGALLLGGIVASTDAAAVFFLLRTGGLRLQSKVGSVLEIESGTNDPIAVFLTILLTEFLMADRQVSAWALLAELAEHGLIGAVLGVAGGFGAVVLLNRVQMPEGLHPLFVVVSALMIYSTTAQLGGSGLLAVYLAGLVVANRPVRAYPVIVGFHDAATWLCQIVMFLVLGLLVTPTTLVGYAVPGVTIALFLIFIARPVAVWLCLWPFGFDHKEKLFVSWVGLRGAVTIFLATIPTLAGVPHAEVFFNIAFFVVFVSLLAQGWTITPLARRLGLALRLTAPSVRRVEVDLPGQNEQEMVGYPVTADSMVLALSRLPGWARPVLVIREKEILNPVDAGPLQAGDYVYLLAPPERVSRLDRLFGESRDVARRLGPLFGELPFNGDTNLSEISGLYNLDLSEESLALTVTEFFARYSKVEPQPGFRLRIGNGILVARSVENGQVERAGLQLGELTDEMLAEESFLGRFRAKLGSISERLRKISFRGPFPRKHLHEPSGTPEERE